MQSDVPSVQKRLACPCNCGNGILKCCEVGWGVGLGLVLDTFNFSKINGVLVRSCIFTRLSARID